ncbi:serine/threonine-protein kinase pim-1-like [Enoplosus armatus]|uniref:serine/threonine-protein kinase pim-1-like n=1 Tax=Enoplosus armatus TaxID=215367 RepID=UPI0039968312
MQKLRTLVSGKVQGSPMKKTQGGDNITHSADPCDNMQEEVGERKRRAGDDGQMPGKRVRCSDLTNPTKNKEVSVEVRRVQTGKRKASVDARTSQKKIRCSSDDTNTTDPSAVSGVNSKKRKADHDGETPKKRGRCSDSNTAEPGVKVKEDARAGENDVSAASEEEKIYQMSSTGNKSRADFNNKYHQLAPIGKGGFGSVYSGLRSSDLLPVAIKYIPRKDVMCQRVTCNGKEFKIILEVALMLKAAGLPGPVGQSAAVSLLDWYILDQELILVMERPLITKDLSMYLRAHRGSLDEHEAKMILRQLVDAAIDMHAKGVFHRDIKLQNVLIQFDSGVPRVRVIDFGCGSFSTETSYYSFCGTPAYAPPEWFDYRTYWARQTTVWQLGALFYSLLGGHERFSTMGFMHNHIKINSALSPEVKTLLHMCLARDPMERATLEELQLSPALRQPSPPPTPPSTSQVDLQVNSSHQHHSHT